MRKTEAGKSEKGKIQTVNLRFDLSKDIQRGAWERLRTMDRKRFRSYAQLVSVALSEYFERQSRLRDEPDMERREWEEAAVSRIVARVEDSVNRNMPDVLSRCLVGLFGSLSPVQVQNAAKNSDAEWKSDAERKSGKPDETGGIPDDLIDWDFLGC